MKLIRILPIIMLLLFSLTFISSVDISSSSIIGVNIIPEELINYSNVNVNNSQYLRGLIPQEVADLYQELWQENGNDIYYNDGNVNIDNNLTAGYYLGDGTYLNTSIQNGSIIFSNGLNFAEDNEYFKWDNENKRLGVRIPSINSPSNTIDIGGNINFDSIAIPTNSEIGGIILTEGTGGTLAAGTYYYNIQWLDAYGNSCGSSYSTSPSITVSANAKVTLTNIPISTDSRVTGRRIMRTNVGGGANLAYKIAEIDNNVDTTFVDTGYTGDTSYRIYRSPDKTAGEITINGLNALLLQDFNTIIGKNAGSALTTGDSNIIIGVSSGVTTTTGSNSNMIGYASGLGITTGGYNDAHGYAAMYGVGASSNSNVAMGGNALRSSATQSSNVAAGTYSLYGSTYSQTGNIAMGYRAGRAIATTGVANYNTMLGYYAGYGTLTSGSYNILIGANTDVPVSTSSYYLNIGDLITGSMTSSKYVDIDGDLKQQDNYKHFFGSADDVSIYFNGSNFNLNGEIGSPDFLINLNGGNVGINTSSPEDAFQVGGNVRIENTLWVGPKGQFPLGEGDISFSGRVLGNGSINTFSDTLGLGIAINPSGSQSELIFSLNDTASYQTETQVLCDTINPFNEDDAGKYITMIYSVPTDYADSVGFIQSYINSSCVIMNVGAFGDSYPENLSTMLYVISSPPSFGVLDNGVLTATIGQHPDAVFKINQPNATGDDNFVIDMKAGVDGTTAISRNTDMNGNNFISVIEDFFYSSIIFNNTKTVKNIFTNDLTNLIGGEYFEYEFDMVGTNSTTHTLFKVSSEYENIVEAGQEIQLSKAYYDNTIQTVDITENITNSNDLITVLENDNSILYFGNSDNFTSIQFILDTISSQAQSFIAYYCNSTGGWEAMSISDNTNGFTNQGTISFANPSNRGTCNQEIDGTYFANSTNYTYIALQRTRNFIVTDPVLNLASISNGEEKMKMTKDLLRLIPNDNIPEICTAAIKGAIYFDNDEDTYCVCKSTGWKDIEDGSTCT